MRAAGSKLDRYALWRPMREAGSKLDRYALWGPVRAAGSKLDRYALWRPMRAAGSKLDRYALWRPTRAAGSKGGRYALHWGTRRHAHALLFQARALGGVVVLATVSICASARAAADPQERPITPGEVESWLDSKGEPPPDQGRPDDDLVPPPPPRHKGFVAESGIGALGQVGAMKHISPIAPWFHTQFGFEPFRFLMLFAEGDLVLSNTSYAQPPPPSRTYALWGFGGGLRGTVKATDRVGLYLQASAGGAEVTGDVLALYGYRNADRLNLYFAAELGVEWYQVSRHLALAVHGGLRDYTKTFERESSNEPPLAWLSGVALRYTF